VVLEGYAAGVPSISTDVGSCRQLIYGFGPDDEALGAAGRVVGIADPAALADAAVELSATSTPGAPPAPPASPGSSATTPTP
jgi:glycosyltransferase involved in cell wall biosynthesis